MVQRCARVLLAYQVETPDMLKARNASKGRSGEKDKVVKRELCSILSRGTRTYCFLDDVSSTPDGSPRSVNMILSIKVRVLVPQELEVSTPLLFYLFWQESATLLPLLPQLL